MSKGRRNRPGAGRGNTTLAVVLVAVVAVAVLAGVRYWRVSRHTSGLTIRAADIDPTASTSGSASKPVAGAVGQFLPEYAGDTPGVVFVLSTKPHLMPDGTEMT